MKGLRRAFILFLLIGAPALHALVIVRGPYLGRADDVSLTIIWRTDVPADGETRLFDPAGNQVALLRDAAVVVEHRLRFPNLTPGLVYRYEIRGGGEILVEDGSAQAPLSPQTDLIRFAAFGDTAGEETPRRIGELLIERDLRLVLHTGDIVYPTGASEDYDRKFFEPLGRWLKHGVMLPTLGNHDAMTRRGEPLLQNFVLPTNGDRESRYFSVREGPALFVCLDVETSSYGKGSDQYRWLEQTLKQTDATWKFVWFHEPPYSSSNSNQVIRFVLAPLLEKYAVDIVFCGHAHLYERTTPIRDFTTGSGGVVYITAGGGGASFSRFVPQERTAVVAAKRSFVVIEINGPLLTGTAVDVDGAVFDQFSIRKNVARKRAVRR